MAWANSFARVVRPEVTDKLTLAHGTQPSIDVQQSTRLILSILTLSVIVSILPGCATILAGTSQGISFVSDPPGAQVTVGPHSGKTPVTLMLPKGKDYPVAVELGDKKKTFALTRVFDRSGLLNILIFPGFLVDAVTGAITKYEPDTFSIDFSSID